MPVLTVGTVSYSLLAPCLWHVDLQLVVTQYTLTDSFDPVIPEVKTGADEEVPNPTYYLNFRTVHLAQSVGAMLGL